MKAQFIKKINMIARSVQEAYTAPMHNEKDQQIIELESRIAYLENSVDELNTVITQLSSEFSLAKEALRMMHRNMESLKQDSAGIKNLNNETPPPHY